MGSAIGAVVAYVGVCFLYGQLLPVLCVPTIVAVMIGGIVGQLVVGR